MAGDNVKTATEQNFESEVLQSSTPALIDFWAPWCGPCRAIAPIIEELANDNVGKINIYKLNTDDYPEIAAKYGVRGIPTVLTIKNGEVVSRVQSVRSKDDYQKMIDAVVS